MKMLCNATACEKSANYAIKTILKGTPSLHFDRRIEKTLAATYG